MSVEFLREALKPENDLREFTADMEFSGDPIEIWRFNEGKIEKQYPSKWHEYSITLNAFVNFKGLRWLETPNTEPDHIPDAGKKVDELDNNEPTAIKRLEQLVVGLYDAARAQVDEHKQLAERVEKLEAQVALLGQPAPNAQTFTTTSCLHQWQLTSAGQRCLLCGLIDPSIKVDITWSDNADMRKTR